MRKIIFIFFTAFILVGIFGCLKKNDDGNEEIVIKNGGTIELKNEQADIYYEGGYTSSKVKTRSAEKNRNFGYNIIFSAIVSPIEVDGEIVQANDIKIDGNKAYIAYNYAGDEFRGAVQIINITDKSNPVIIKEIQFKDIDINCIYVKGNTMLYGGQANPDKYTEGRSVVGYIDLSNLDNLTEEELLNGMHFYNRSYAVTSIARRGENYYIGVGAAEGGVIITDLLLKEISTAGFISIEDVRDIEEYDSGVVLLAGTTDVVNGSAKVAKILDKEVKNEIAIDSLKSQETKATIEVWKGTIALLGLSEGGMAAVNLLNDEIYFNIANPDSSVKHVTNSVTGDGALIFTANGEYGFRVLDVDETKINTDFATVAGYYPYEGLTDREGNNYSANHIVYKSGYLFVASGVGGVNIFNLSKK